MLDPFDSLGIEGWSCVSLYCRLGLCSILDFTVFMRLKLGLERHRVVMLDQDVVNVLLHVQATGAF